jgi:DNA (cytosine-5)-methyltransferase 1
VLSTISLFAGIGGLDLGFRSEGFQVTWANEIHPNAAASYERNLCHAVAIADINALRLSDIPRADIVIGGPPCQAFSLVGKRAPDDPRGQLVFRFLDVVKAVRPNAFVMENVPGMAASRLNGVRLPSVLAEKFSRAGYAVTSMALTASDYLVPQRRTRLFLVGSLDVSVSPPDPDKYAAECHGIDKSAFDVSAKAAIGDLGPCVARGQRAPYGNSPASQFASMMRNSQLTDVSLHECPRMSSTDLRLLHHIPPGGNYKDVPDYAATPRIMRFKASGGRTTTYGRLHPQRPAYTINTYFRRPNVGANFHYAAERLITPREALRFQSFPDDFELTYGAQDERNAMIGNAVPPLLARAVAWALRTSLGEPKRTDSGAGI